MKITAIEAIQLTIPARRLRTALGEFAAFEYGLVVVRTDDGIEGYGEICTLWDGAGPVQCAFVRHAFAPALLGEDPTAINRCVRRMDTLQEQAWPARAGIEMALFDIAGKAHGVPVYELLGGRTREAVVLSRSITFEAGEAAAETARRYVAEGFTCMKVKVGRELAADEESVAAVRAAIGPDVLLRVDANMGWPTPKAAIRAIRVLGRYDLHSVEQPIPPGDVEALRAVRMAVDVPIMADESVWGPNDAWELLRAGAVDLLNVYVAESGGLTNAALIFRMAELGRVGCLVGAMPELGIGTSAGVHLAVSMTNLHDPCDASGVIYQDVDIVHESHRVEGGRIWPLPGPGLGVTIDWDAVDRFRAPT